MQFGSRILRRSKRFSTARALGFGLFAALLLATSQPASAEDYLQIVNRWFPGEVLQGDGTGVAVAGMPSDPTKADWTVESDGKGGYRIKNRSSGAYLSNTGGNAALVADASAPGTLWTTSVIDNFVRLIGAGSDAVLDRPAAATLKLEATPEGHWSSQWQLKWNSLPQFAIDDLSAVSDWTKTDPKDRDKLLFAALAMANAPDTDAGIALKKKWASVFPYDVGAGDNNRGENVLLDGKAMDTPKQGYNAQTTALYATGFYAAPGETITITVPTAFVAKGASVQIGNLDEGRPKNNPFIRFPFSLSVSRKIDAEKVTIRNGFGGPIYIQNDAGFDTGGNWINVAGGTRMPIFRLGVTGLEAWRSKIRHYAAPWAEISSNSLAVTLPSELIRWLDNPDQLAWYWERMMQEEDALVGLTQFRKAPDRADLDIGMPPGIGGWAGDHTMTAPIGWAADYLAGPQGTSWWGWYHELGHNHQAPAWGGVGKTSELTNNIALLYARYALFKTGFSKTLEAAGPNVPREYFTEVTGHFALDEAARQGIWTMDADPNNYATSKPSAKLTLFAWLSESFGWDIFKTAFLAYQAPGFKMPADAQEQAETLALELSKAAGRDLSAYFELWGQPLGATTTAAMAAFPKWEPTSTASIGFDIRFLLSKRMEGTDASAFKLRNLRFTLEGGGFAGNVIWRKGGGKVGFDLEFDPTCLDCTKPSHIIVGIRKQDTGGAFVWSGLQTNPKWSTFTNSFWNGWTGSLDVPSQSGTYEVAVIESENDNRDAALKAAQAAKFEGDTIGLVLVTP